MANLSRTWKQSVSIMFWSRYAWGHRLCTNLTGSWVGHRACLPGNKPVFQCETTCWIRYQSKLQGTKRTEVPEFCYWSFHSQFQLKWHVCLHSSPPTYSYCGQHITVSNSYLSWITLKVKYHQKTQNFSCFSVFTKIRDLLTVLTCMKSYLSKQRNFTLKAISWMSIKFCTGSLH